MSHIVLVKRCPTDGQLYVLCHRRGKHIREPFHWGIPGGGFDREERYTLHSLKDISDELRYQVSRRAALRETIEECGGGDHSQCPARTVAICEISCNGVACISEVLFHNVILPPGLLEIIKTPRNCRLIDVPYGSCNAKTTAVVVYVMDPGVDAAFFGDWSPRAMKPFRAEIDETYSEADCIYGQKWYVD